MGRVSCPHCGEILPSAEAAVLTLEGEVINTWRCDGCAAEFETVADMSGGRSGSAAGSH
jgi:hypothetical protein